MVNEDFSFYILKVLFNRAKFDDENFEANENAQLKQSDYVMFLLTLLNGKFLLNY
jgi:hypothetical protein